MKEHAEGILDFFIAEAGSSLDPFTIESALKKCASLALPLEVKRGIPLLLKEFFQYCSAAGLFSGGGSWEKTVGALEAGYRASFRDDGSVRGDTFKKNYTDTGRNDPCPCGSGKKFKKCCMELIA